MKHFFILLVMCAGIHLNAGAQTFTQRIQKNIAGKGSVSIHQSHDIDQLVNSAQLAPSRLTTPPTPTPPTTTTTPSTAITPTKPGTDAPTATVTAGTAISELTDPVDAPVDNTKKIMKGGVKINGYRVQAFAGGNSRKDRLEAEQVGSKIKASYPEEPIYVHFYSPRWICRVGNYRTYEEAHQMLLSVRKLGFMQATIVKGKITVPN